MSEEGASKRPKTLEDDVGEWLAAQQGEPEAVSSLDAIIAAYGAEAVQAWEDQRNKHRHRIVHVVTCKGWCECLDHLAKKHKFDLDVQRASDQCTAAHLAIWYKKEAVLKKLWELGADTSIPNKYGDTADQKWKEERERYDNLIFLDLELTCGFYEKCKGQAPKILEAAVIVTGKDLQEKGRGKWVVGGYGKEQLEALGDFHQANFRDAEPGGAFPPLPGAERGGNGLFADILKSGLTAQEAESAMLDLIRKHCPENACPLVGYSVQCDREVLMVEMPRLYAYLSHQIVDISSFITMAKAWVPEKLKARGEARQSKYNHRALNDCEDGIETLSWVREHFFQAPPPPREAAAGGLEKKE